MLNLADNLLEHIDQAAFEPLKRLKGKKHIIKTNMIRIYCSKYVYSANMLLKFYLHQMQYLAFFKRSKWPFFWRKAIDHSLTSGSTVPVVIVAKPGRMLEEKLEELIFL